ncbi:2'-5' RNA ligase family protein [Veronia pacifica]|uniref:2'-5' RNA ligase n=1 Tax=Veronia pacifica TaxID=1080227 RepID=A0A1C3EIE0_9GAMM|nr:2'-5' RNA ligase family protein [Veronia pacifica]ODA33011.1 hypothetical protein A8L45_12015 [Veronia pacifica]
MYYVAVIPESIPEIESIRADIDPLVELSKAHITLVFPHQWESLNDAIKHIENIAANVSPFSVVARDFTGQDGDLIFLNIKKGNDELIELHDMLYSGPFQSQLDRKQTYIPHITVGRVTNPFAWQENIEALTELNNSISFDVTSMSVLEITQSGDELIRDIELSG